jgi:hypothetical protein
MVGQPDITDLVALGGEETSPCPTGRLRWVGPDAGPLRQRPADASSPTDSARQGRYRSPETRAMRGRVAQLQRVVIPAVGQQHVCA